MRLTLRECCTVAGRSFFWGRYVTRRDDFPKPVGGRKTGKRGSPSRTYDEQEFTAWLENYLVNLNRRK